MASLTLVLIDGLWGRIKIMKTLKYVINLLGSSSDFWKMHEGV